MVLKTHYATFLALASPIFSHFLYTIRRSWWAQFGANRMSKYLSVLDIFRKRSQNKVPEWYWKHIMQFFSHLPDRIFLIFCIPLEGDIGHILAQTACRNDLSFSIYWGKGAKIGVRIGTENLLCRFLQFASLDFSDFQQAVRAQHWVHLRRICISKDFRFLTFWSKRAKNWRFWIFLKIRFLVLCKETLFFFYTCRWVLCPVLNFFHLQDWSYSLWLV